MTNPLEQFATIARANQALFLKFADISRAAAQRQAEIATQSMSAFSQASQQKPEAAALPDVSGFSHLLTDAGKNCQETVTATQNAVQQWWAEVGASFTPGSGPQDFTAAFQSWSRQFLPAAAEKQPAKK